MVSYDPEQENLSNQIQDSSSTEEECREIEYEYWDSDSIEELTEFFFQDFEDAYEEANTICYDAYEDYIQASYEVSPHYIDQTAEEVQQDIDNAQEFVRKDEDDPKLPRLFF